MWWENFAKIPDSQSPVFFVRCRRTYIIMPPYNYYEYLEHRELCKSWQCDDNHDYVLPFHQD